jgi:hypothetical protein
MKYRNLHNYIQKINTLYQQGNATEHSYRGDLAQLIEAIVSEFKSIIIKTRSYDV